MTPRGALASRNMTVVQPVAHRSRGRRGTGYLAHQVFFPVAALFAALGPWLLLTPLPGAIQPVVDVSTHARGMLFGYVGALIAGFLGGRLSGAKLGILLGLWLVGRGFEIVSSNPLLINTLYTAFGLYLAILVVPRFSAAKKWRNRLIAPLLAVITCFPLLYWAGGIPGRAPQVSVHTLLLLIALLMFFMGGRFITPTLARAYADRGERLPQRVQPRLEGVVMLLLLMAGALSVVHATGGWTAVPTGLAGILVLVRLLRWQLFPLGPRHADLMALGVGYLWLGLGLVTFSIAMAGYLSPATSLHVITVGALGTLSSTIMLKHARDAEHAPPALYNLVILLLFVATVARFLVDVAPGYRTALLTMAGSLWSLNFLLVAGHLVIGKRCE